MNDQRVDTVSLTEAERVQLESGLKILSKLIARVWLREVSEKSKIVHSAESKSLLEDQKEVQHEKLTYSVDEVAKLLGLSRSATYEAVHTGQIPSLKFGKRLFIPKAALVKLLAGPIKTLSG